MPDRPRWMPDYFQALVGDSNKVSIGPRIPSFDYIPIDARFGWYLTDPLAPGAVSFLVGNTSGIVTNGFGSYFTGPSVAFRYERRPDRDWVPYIQIGSGLALNDAYKDKAQRAIGSVTEFCDQFEAGVRYRITGSLSWDAEVAYQHISNARLAGRNLGVNNVAFLTGFTYTFGCR
jgi:lipid A 3-O-deacylase